MKSFKEHLKNDIENTFLNNLEFAEEVEIEGHSMTVLIEDDKSKKYSKKNGYDYGYTNHSEVNKTITLRESDYALLGSPEREDRLSMDDRSYLILEIEKDDGVINLKVQVYR